MSDFSSILNLPYLLPNQAQKHVTANEWFEHLDALVQLSVIDATLADPPADPQSGDRYIVPAAATGDWAGQGGALAVFEFGWKFVTPQDGWRAWDRSAGELLVFAAGQWSPISTGGSSGPFDLLGVNATADTNNRLSVSSPASLLNHEGADHRLKINKASSVDTASILYQTNFTGHAEIGLTGNNGFEFKTSPDGASWSTRLDLPASESGIITPSVRSERVSVAKDAVASIPTPNAGGFVMFFLSDDAFPQTHHSGIYVFDSGSSLELRTVWQGFKVNNLDAAALTGATGPDGHTNIGVQSGELQIENRQYSNPVTYDFLFIG